MFYQNKDARIIIGNFYEYDAIPIFCEVSQFSTVNINILTSYY